MFAEDPDFGMPECASGGLADADLLDQSLFDDFCSFFLLQEMYFPIEVSRINKTSSNPFIQCAQRAKIASVKGKILEIARLKGKACLEAAVKDLMRALMQNEHSALSTPQLKQALEYIFLYSTGCPVELALTFRYHTAQGECCIVARSPIAKGTLIPGLAGTFCPLPASTVELLKEENRDFSLMYSASVGTQGIFVGTARFLNHDCKPNCEFSLVSRQQVKVKALKDIGIGQELTVFYDKNYFGLLNKDCLCESCTFESNKRCINCTATCLPTGKRANLRSRNSFISPCSECKNSDEKRLKQLKALDKRNLKLFQRHWPLRR